MLRVINSKLNDSNQLSVEQFLYVEVQVFIITGSIIGNASTMQTIAAILIATVFLYFINVIAEHLTQTVGGAMATAAMADPPNNR